MSEKNLKYVECPNCKEILDKEGEFSLGRNFVGIHKFTCNNCKKKFKYPTNKKYIIDLIIGIVLWYLSATVNTYDITTTGVMSAVGIAGFFLTLQGAWGGIENSSLKKKYTDWENKIHNTKVVSK
jgi:hypothetical protein